MTYKSLSKEAYQQGVDIYEKPMTSRIKGLYSDNVIWINKFIPTTSEKACILAEELGHYYTSVGNILDQDDINNRKQERRARGWAYERLIPWKKIVHAYHNGARSNYELAEELDVSERFLESALHYYREKYGLF